MRAEWGRRAGAAGAAALTVVAGLGCRAVAYGAVAKYAGDALYTVLICALAAVLAPCARPFAVAGAGLLFSWAVELALRGARRCAGGPLGPSAHDVGRGRGAGGAAGDTGGGRARRAEHSAARRRNFVRALRAARTVAACHTRATPRPVPQARESLLRQARAGASYVFRDRLLLGLALRPAVGNVAFLAVETVLAHLMGRVASTSRVFAMCAAPFGAFLGGRPATTYDVRTPIYAAAGLLLTMTAVTSTMTGNRQVEAALRAAATADDPDHPESRLWPDSCER